jgi:hypothetical protein
MKTSVEPVVVKYNPPPTIARFYADNSQVRGVMGGTGSGKSVACVGELIYRAGQQEPDESGVRRTRWGVFRRTYPSLIGTTIKTWNEWAPGPPVAKMVMSPPVWRWQQKKAFPDGTGVDMEVLFIAIDDPRTDVDKLRSLDLTGAWCNEAQEIQDRLLIEWMLNRCGRYPRSVVAPLTWSGLIMDANAMPITHWWYKWAEVVRPTGFRFFQQPSSLLPVEKQQPGAVQDGQGQWWILNPLCENVVGQPKHERYWLDQVAGKDSAWIKLNLCGQYGASMYGKPIYAMFDESRHVAKEPLEPVAGCPLQIGFDYGMTPTAVICQITPAGQLRVLDECCSTNKGMRQFLQDDLKPMLANKYHGWPVIGVGDPAGKQRAQSNESTAMDEIRAVGIDIKEAPTNLFGPRREAVISFMMKRVMNSVTGGPGGEGFLVSPTCAMLLEGFRQTYVFGRRLIEGREGFKEEPVDNEATHSQDCVQYVAVTYDRPKLWQQEMDRRFNSNGSPIELGFDPGFPMI